MAWNIKIQLKAIFMMSDAHPTAEKKLPTAQKTDDWLLMRRQLKKAADYLKNW